ncbi:MAG: M56 family metallopeptidase [Clostridia bacterium]|nr:M56 family metallopeptidase [Clostridia bacterium]
MEILSAIFLRLLNMSITAGWIVLVVIVLRLLLRRAPKALVSGLWLLVAIRLILPFSLESGISLIPSVQTVPPDITQSANPSIHTGIPSLNTPVNEMLHQHFTPDTSAVQAPLETITHIAAWLWILGALGMFAYEIISFWLMYRQVRIALPIQKGVRICDAVDSPFILGIFRPVIYLPSTLDEAQRAYVIAHEQTHLKRRDHWWKPIGFFLLAVYWFNPLLWVAYILLCRDIELACDEQVVRHMEAEDKQEYASTLLHCSVHRRQIAACPVAFGETAVGGRIRSILNYRKPTVWILATSVIAILITTVCLLTNPDQPYSDAELLDMVQQIAANEEVAHSSRAEDYINASPALYDKLLAGGNATVDCFVRTLRSRTDNGLEEYIMAVTCSRITGIGYGETPWSSAREWLTLYDETTDGVVRISPVDSEVWVLLREEDSQALLAHIQKHTWEEKTSNCDFDCRISAGGQVLLYATTCGTLQNQSQLLTLTKEERQTVNTLLTTYIALSEHKPPALSESDALQRVQQYEPPQDGLYYECERLEDHSLEDGEAIRVYVFHVYSLGEEPLEGEQGEYRQQFTKGWYMVDVDTGAVYDYMTERPATTTTTTAQTTTTTTTTTTHVSTTKKTTVPTTSTTTSTTTTTATTTTIPTTTTTTTAATTTTTQPPVPTYAEVLAVQHKNAILIDGVDMWDRLFGNSLEKGYTVLQNGDSLSFRGLYAPPGTHFEGGASIDLSYYPSAYFYDGSCSFVQDGDIWTGTVEAKWDRHFIHDTSSPMAMSVSLKLKGDDYAYKETVCSIKTYVFEEHKNTTSFFCNLLRLYAQHELGMKQNSALVNGEVQCEEIHLDDNQQWMPIAADTMDRLAEQGFTSFCLTTDDASTSTLQIYVCQEE